MKLTRATKAALCLAFLSMLPNFFNPSWHGLRWRNISIPLALAALFSTGLFLALANISSLIDFWGPATNLGRITSAPETSSTAVLTMRIAGVSFMLFALSIAFAVIHWATHGTAHS